MKTIFSCFQVMSLSYHGIFVNIFTLWDPPNALFNQVITLITHQSRPRDTHLFFFLPPFFFPPSSIKFSHLKKKLKKKTKCMFAPN